MELRTYENFPVGIVLLSNTFILLIYSTGAYIVAQLGLWLVILYIGYCLLIEYRVLKLSCVNCYYYGKLCGLGKGRLCSLLLKKGDPENFKNAAVSWWDVLPDFMVSIIPLVGGIILLIRDFSWILFVLLLFLLGLSSAGNAVIRGSFLCKYCKQREIGCPAQKLFNPAQF